MNSTDRLREMQMKGGGGSKSPKILQTSYVHAGPSGVSRVVPWHGSGILVVSIKINDRDVASLLQAGCSH